MLEQIFLKVLNMSLTASVVIIFVLISRLFLSKLPKIFSYALWSVVLFRLVCPFSFESVLSLLPTKANPIPQDIMYMAKPQIDTGLPAVNNSINAILPSPNVVGSINPLQVWIFLAASIWVLGIVVMVLYSIVSIAKLHIKLKSSTCEGENIYTFAGQCSPFVLGLFAPKIYLPSNISSDEKRYILEHEHTHIKRFDPLVKMVGFCALSVHWFNPLCWVAFAYMSKDMELACDEAVIEKLGSDIKPDYSSSLLSLAAGHKILRFSPLAFGESNIKARVKNVLDYKKPAFWILIATLITVVAVAFGLVSNPRSKPQNAITIKGAKLVEKEVMASITLENGFDVKLVLIKGQTFLAEATDFGVGTYPTNFKGEYQLQVLTDNQIVSTVDADQLRSLAFDGKELNFDKPFELETYDYNGDGKVDFSLGQPNSSSSSVFSLFSVDDTGKITTLEVTGGLVTSDKSFSPLLRQVADDAFEFARYDNSLGGNALYTAIWKENAFDVTANEMPPNTIKWVQSLSAKDVAAIELVVAPAPQSKSYKKYADGEISLIVQLLNQSEGEFLPYNETLSGKMQTFYITTKNGEEHSVTNGGNVYLIVDGQFYKGSADFLNKWAFDGDSAVPASFYMDEVPIAPTVPVGEVKPQDFVEEIVKSFQIKEGVATFKIPSKAPFGYNLSQLAIQVSGLMPIKDGSNFSLHAFEKEGIEKDWQLGKEYAEEMFNGAVTDKTEVYIHVSLSEKDGTGSIYNAGNSKVFPLRDDGTAPSVKTTATTVTFTDKFGDILNLSLTLPKGFSMKQSSADYNGTPAQSVDIYFGNSIVGGIFCSSFDLYQSEGGDISYMSVYGEFMMGSMATWDNEYTEVYKTKTSSTATCKPISRITVPGVSGAALAYSESRGILSYNTELLKYAAISFDLTALTDNQLQSIAKTVKLSK